MDEKTAKNWHLYTPISQKFFSKSEVIHWTQRMNKKLLSLRKS